MPQPEASEQPSLTSIKPPEVSKSYTIVGVSILSHIHPGADAANGKFQANTSSVNNDEVQTHKNPFPLLFVTNGQAGQAMLISVSRLNEANEGAETSTSQGCEANGLASLRCGWEKRNKKPR